MSDFTDVSLASACILRGLGDPWSYLYESDFPEETAFLNKLKSVHSVEELQFFQSIYADWLYDRQDYRYMLLQASIAILDWSEAQDHRDKSFFDQVKHFLELDNLEYPYISDGWKYHARIPEVEFNEYRFWVIKITPSWRWSFRTFPSWLSLLTQTMTHAQLR